MALKKVSRPMKIITIIIAIAMVIPVFVQLYSVYANRETKNVILKVDGEKIYKEDFEKKFAQFSTQIAQIDEQLKNQLGKDFKGLPENILKAQVLSSEINDAINKILIKKLDVSVSKREIDNKFKEFENEMGGSKHLVATLNARGLKIEDLRASLKEFALNEKKVEAIKSKIKIADEELEKRFNQLKHGEYEYKSFVEVKEELRDKILASKAMMYEFSLKEKIFNEAKIVIKDQSFKEIFDYLNTVVYKQDNYEYKNIEVISQYINLFYSSRKSYDESFVETLKEAIKNDLNKKIRIKDEAIKAGLKLNEDLGPKQQLEYIIEDYMFYILDTYKAPETKLKEIFEANKSAFDKAHTVNGEIIGVIYHATEKDIKATEEKVKKLMSEITNENFEKYAKEYSIDTSAQNGGNLGKANLNNFVAPFKNALLKAKEGEIVGPVLTDFGYHIIQLISRDKTAPNLVEVRHILLPIEISEETKKEQKAKVLEIKDLISSNKLTWEEINSDKTGKYDNFEIKDHIAKAKIDSKLPRIGYSKEINEKLFNAKVNEFIEVEVSDAFILIQKTQDSPFKKATFEEVKDKLEFLAANEYLIKHLSEI